MTEAETRGVVGAAIDAGGKVLTTMPGQFLALCLINVCFLLGLFWFLSHQGEARERVIATIVAGCLDRDRGK